MNFGGRHVGDVFTYSFTMERSDFLALNKVLRRRSFMAPVLLLVLYFSVVAIFVLAGVDGDPAAFAEVTRQIATGKAPVWIYPLLALGPLLVLLRPFYLEFLAGQIYRRNVMADRQLTYRFASDAIQGGIPEVQGRFLWSAIKRIIVTPEHAFLTLSRREALIIPRRAVPSDEDFDTLLAFARARIAAARP
jgi:hypothetical protein